jgi:PncC family amidohydrolase
MLKEKGLYVVTVESCTGGGLANCITNVTGASGVFKGGYVTYCNAEKFKLGVPEAVIEEFTVYSEETALAMADAGLRASAWARVSIGITGSLSRADPDNPNSKVGDVYIGICVGDRRESHALQLGANDAERADAKDAILSASLAMLLFALRAC